MCTSQSGGGEIPPGVDGAGTAELNLCGWVWAHQSSPLARLDRFVTLLVFYLKSPLLANAYRPTSGEMCYLLRLS